MSDLFKSLFEAFFGEKSDKKEIIEYDKEKAQEEILAYRKYTKNDFFKNLKEKLFLTDDELSIIENIINESIEKTDALFKGTTYKDKLPKMHDIDKEAAILRKQLARDLKAKINEIMRNKANKAKEYFENKSN